MDMDLHDGVRAVRSREELRGVELAHPFTPARLRVYLVLASLQLVVVPLCAVGVGTELLQPTMTLDVVANVAAVLASVALPLAVFFLVEPGLRRDAELTLVWLPLTAAGQFGFESIWLVGQLFDLWQPTDDPGWTWMWWQYALADGRYFGVNTLIFGLELSAVVCGGMVLAAFAKLVRPELSDAARIRSLMLALAGLTALTTNTLLYFGSILRDGFASLGQGPYGVVKIVALNAPYLVFPVFVLFAIGRQISHLATRETVR